MLPKISRLTFCEQDMRRLMPIDAIVRLLVSAFSVLILLHLLIIADLIPGAWLWADRADNPDDLAALERLSLAVMLIALVLTLLRRGALHSGQRLKESAFGLWLIVLYLVFNGIGALSAGLQPTALIIGPISFGLAFAVSQLALDDGDDDGR
jgi:hypothetical protein